MAGKATRMIMAEENDDSCAAGKWGKPRDDLGHIVDNSVRLQGSGKQRGVEMGSHISPRSVYDDAFNDFAHGQISRIYRSKMNLVSPPREPLSYLVDCAFGPTCKGMPDIPVVKPEDAHVTAIAQWV